MTWRGYVLRIARCPDGVENIFAPIIIYKSSLKPKDFEKIMKHMYENRNLLTEFEHIGPRPPNEMLH